MMIPIVMFGMLFTMLGFVIATRFDIYVAIVALVPQATRERRGDRGENEDQSEGRLRPNHSTLPSYFRQSAPVRHLS
jgi:hypothetical protein